MLGSCSSRPETAPTPEPYSSADAAATAFATEVYSASMYVRHEFVAEIYAREINGQITYNYTTPRPGTPHSINIRSTTPEGTTLVGYVHTHIFSVNFSDKDMESSVDMGVNAYVVGPKHRLYRYEHDTAFIREICEITPTPLSEMQKHALVSCFRASWENHVNNPAGCHYRCRDITWPTP